MSLNNQFFVIYLVKIVFLVYNWFKQWEVFIFEPNCILNLNLLFVKSASLLIVLLQRVRHPQHHCVLDLLEINDPVIYNTLIDQRGIENILLIKDIEEAKRLMSKRPPANCKAVSNRNIFLICQKRVRC